MPTPIPVGGQMTGQAKANIDALPTYSAPGSAGTQPVAKTAAEGKALNDFKGGLPSTSPTSPTSPVLDPLATAPNNAQVNPPNGATADLSKIVGAQYYDQKTGALNQTGENYKAALAHTTASGAAVPTTSGAAATTINNTLKPPAPDLPAPVQNFLNPETNKSMGEQIQQIMDIVSPQATKDNLATEMAKITGEKNTLAQEKFDYMNIQNIMSGTEQDIRDEVTKANGFATNSQVLAMSIGRNASLLKQATLLQNQMSLQQDLISNDTQMLASDKADAASQLSTRMGLLTYIQTNQNNQLNAYKDSIKTMINTPGGLTALAADPAAAKRAEDIYGWASGTVANMSKEATIQTNLDNAVKRSTIAKNLKDLNPLGGLSLKDYTTTSSTGKQYVDLSTVSDKTEKKQVEGAARAQGIPVVTDANAGKMNAIEDTRTNLDNIKAQFDKIGYSSGGSKIAGVFGLSNKIKELAGNTDIGSFKAWRTAAINSIQALAGGSGSGLRINQAEINSAMENDIPNLGDTKAVGNAKLDVLKKQLDSWENIITGSKDRSQNNLSDENLNGIYRTSSGKGIILPGQ